MRLAIVVAVVVTCGAAWAEPSTCSKERAEFRRLAALSEKSEDVIDVSTTNEAGRILTKCEESHPSEVDEVAGKIEKNPKAKRFALSASLCALAEWRKETTDTLARERKYDRETGVIRIGERNRLRTDLESADRTANAVRALLRGLKLAPMSCNKAVAGLGACFRSEISYCEQAEIAAMVKWATNAGAWPSDDE